MLKMQNIIKSAAVEQIHRKSTAVISLGELWWLRADIQFARKSQFVFPLLVNYEAGYGRDARGYRKKIPPIQHCAISPPNYTQN